MLHFFNNRLAVEANWLIDNDIVSLSNYKSMVHRGRLTILRKGTRSLAALVDYESLPDEMKTMVKDLIGDPYTFGLKDELVPYVTPWAEAAQFFNSYKPDGVRNLPADKVKRYYADACVLRAIDLFKEERRFAPHGHAATRWSAIIEHVKEIDVKEWPHRLPTNHLSLQRKFERFKRDGLESLVHKNYRGDEETGWTVAQNCSKIITEEQKVLMMALISDPRNLGNTQVLELYNAKAERMGWETVSVGAVYKWREKYEQEIYARRFGTQRFNVNRLMTVQRSAPTAPLYLWTLDGWDAELLYQDVVTNANGGQKTVYHKRLTLEVVLDPCTKYPIGYAIADTESPALIREALRNAICHTVELFGSRYRPNQLQMDRAGYKSLKDFYAHVANIVTPAAAHNAKAKVIEQWFNLFNERYCHKQVNWSGHNVTAKGTNQPNVEFLNKFRKEFPTREGVTQQLETFIAMERKRLKADYLHKWNAMPEENRFPMSDEEYLMTFGTRTKAQYLMRGTGINLTLPDGSGMKVAYDCFDHNFRRFSSTRWTMIVDPKEPQMALAVNDDMSLRFLMERKHVQPMALIERTEEDTIQLQRVRDFNKAETKRIIAHFGGETESFNKEMLRPHDERASLEAARDAERDRETLSKLLIADSKGQHKSEKGEARLAAAEDESYSSISVSHSSKPTKTKGGKQSTKGIDSDVFNDFLNDY